MGKYTAEKDLNLIVKKRWYVVANRAAAAIYKDSPEHQFAFIERLSNEDGQLTEGNLDSDKPGRSGASGGSGAQHSLDRHSKKHEEAAKKFANKVIKSIEKNIEAAAGHDIKSEIVLVAEPHFMGLLRATIPTGMKPLIVHEISRDYHGLPPEKLHAQILQAIEND